MANRLRCQSPSGVGRKPRPAATRWAIIPSPGGATGRALGVSVAFMGGLLDDGRRRELLGDDATEGAQDSRSGLDGQVEPELARDEATGWTDRARGGTAVVRDRRMMTLLVDPSDDRRGTTRPTGEVPRTRL